jgi:hypothetical protein
MTRVIRRQQFRQAELRLIRTNLRSVPPAARTFAPLILCLAPTLRSTGGGVRAGRLLIRATFVPANYIIAATHGKLDPYLCVSANMGNSKRRTPDTSSRRLISAEWLRRQMSEVISLREKVAQAELSTHRYGPANKEDGEAKSDEQRL